VSVRSKVAVVALAATAATGGWLAHTSNTFVPNYHNCIGLLQESPQAYNSSPEKAKYRANLCEDWNAYQANLTQKKVDNATYDDCTAVKPGDYDCTPTLKGWT
jgi:hypothetical protein